MTKSKRWMEKIEKYCVIKCIKNCSENNSISQKIVIKSNLDKQKFKTIKRNAIITFKFCVTIQLNQFLTVFSILT